MQFRVLELSETACMYRWSFFFAVPENRVYPAKF